MHSCYRCCNEKEHLTKKNYKIRGGKFSWLKGSILFAGEQMYRWYGTGGRVWKNYADWGEMLNPSVEWDSHYQMVFHEFHKRLWWVAGKEPYWLWLLTSPSPCNNMCLYLVRAVKKVVPKWRRQWLSTVVQLLIPVCSYSTRGSGWGGGEATKFCSDGSVLMLQKMLVLHCLQCMLLHGARHCSLAWPLVQA